VAEGWLLRKEEEGNGRGTRGGADEGFGAIEGMRISEGSGNEGEKERTEVQKDVNEEKENLMDVQLMNTEGSGPEGGLPFLNLDTVDSLLEIIDDSEGSTSESSVTTVVENS